MTIPSLICLESQLKKSWSLETCAPDLIRSWSPQNITAGQSSITAILLYDTFKGEIRKCYVNESLHYFNVIDNQVKDLTRSQFGKTKPNYSDSVLTSREEILADPNTKHRYSLLLSKLA